MESYLKKEFRERDVKRIRNIVTKKFGDKTASQVGYTKENSRREEGDVWEEDGRTWTVRNGIRQNLTKLDAVKQLIKVPISCPKCNGPMKHRFSKKMYKIHGFCFDCTIDFEAGLRKAGKFEEYERAMVTGNMKIFARDLEIWAIEQLQESSMGFVTEQGDIEDWGKSSNKSQLEFIKKVKEYKKQVDKL